MISRSGKKTAKKQTGQALLLVTFALVAMCGVLGLAVDLGWSYFVKKEAQAAADGAALAAVAKAQSLVSSPPYTCGTGVQCTAVVSCPTSGSLTGNLNSACVYAGLNGFSQGGKINVTVEANVTSPAPTVKNVKVFYWVTVRVNQQVPQLFSAVLGNTTGLVSARATAALTNVIFNASLDLLNRQNDPSGPNGPGTGVDLNITGGGTVSAPGGMLVASTLNTNQGGNAAANLNSAKSNVTNTPFSLFRGLAGSCAGNGNSNCDVGSAKGDWQQPPTYGVPDGKTFYDPTSLSNAKTQPPLDLTQSTVCPVPGGTLTPKNVSTCAVNGGTALGPGIYYASVSSKDNTATGAQLAFTDTSTQFSNNGSSFGQYIFLGGLTTSPGNQTITFAPGTYVFGGTTNNNPEFFVDNGTTINDANTGGTQINAGELFLYTNYNYNWAAGQTPDGTTSWTSGSLSNMLATISTIPNPAIFDYGPGGFTFKGGNNQNTSMALYGLNPDGAGVPGRLTNYDDFLFWQDRANSFVAYNPDGTIQTTGLGCQNEIPSQLGSIDNPCLNTGLKNPNSPQMNLLATPHTNLNGYLYQPRGAWLNLQGAGSIGGPLRIIAGALILGGSPKVILTGTSAPITVTETALIE